MWVPPFVQAPLKSNSGQYQRGGRQRAQFASLRTGEERPAGSGELGLLETEAHSFIHSGGISRPVLG